MKYSPSLPPPGVAIARSVAAHREHAVQRAVERAGHVGDDVGHRQQVLVVDRLLAQRVARRVTSSRDAAPAAPSAPRTASCSSVSRSPCGSAGSCSGAGSRVLAVRRAGRRVGLAGQRRRAACSTIVAAAARRASPPCAGPPAAASAARPRCCCRRRRRCPAVCSNTRAHRLGDLAAARRPRGRRPRRRSAPAPAGRAALRPP